MLEIRDLSKSYRGTAVLSSLDRSFPVGVTVITGKSGAGKSTLLRLCASAEKPSSGDILWNGVSCVKKPRQFRRSLGYAPQRIDFPEDITGLDFLCHIGALKGVSRKASTQQGLALLGRVGLAPDAKRLIQTYSGGMRRRLGLTQAFLGTPACLILDEPTAELDPQTAKVIHDLVFEAGASAVVIMTTHLAGSLENYDYKSYEITGSHE